VRLFDTWISAAVRCAPPQNKPTPTERDACLPYAAREFELLDARAIICLGAFSWDAALRLHNVSPKPKFTHNAEHETSGPTLLGCYHVSQQNTFTRVLTPAMLDTVLLRAKEISEQGSPTDSSSPSAARMIPGVETLPST